MPETVRTSCTRDCPDACGLLVDVEDGRAVRLRGDPDHPVTRGFLCYRVGTHFLARHYSAERLTTPLRRRDGELVPISWDEAFDYAASEIDRIRRESGPAALLHTQGGGSLGILKVLNHRFSRLLGATETRGDVCDGAGSFAHEADFGAVEANDIDDLENARGIVLWGKNVASSSPHLARRVAERRKNKCPVWLIDPLPTRTTSLADRYTQPRPGGDGALAFAAARVVLDRGWMDEDLSTYAEGVERFLEIVRSRSVEEWERDADVPSGTALDLATFLVERAPVTTLCGWGLQRRGNGVAQLRAIDALHALTGNLGRPGAGISFSLQRKGPFDTSYVTDLAARVPRTVRVPLLGEDLEATSDPPIRGVFIDNHNPVASNPDSATTARALRSREFVMVIDAFLSDTARLADLVLPTTTMLEEADLVGSYGHHFVSATRPVVDRLENTKTDLEIYQELARRLGFGEEMAGSASEWSSRLASKLIADGVSIDELTASARRPAGARRVAFEGRRFPTEQGKFRFLHDYLPPTDTDVDYPLHLIAGSTGRWQTSQLTEEDERREGALEVRVHPDAAQGIEDGGRARLTSRTGSIDVAVRLDGSFRRDTVYVPRARSFHAGRCINQLIGARLTDEGEGAAYYDETVRLTPVSIQAE